MNKVKFVLGLFFASMLFVACSIEDNPTKPEPEPEPPVNIDNPQEQVTDQPAYAPGAE